MILGWNISGRESCVRGDGSMVCDNAPSRLSSMVAAAVSDLRDDGSRSRVAQ
jgi:hypothetical protein